MNDDTLLDEFYATCDRVKGLPPVEQWHEIRALLIKYEDQGEDRADKGPGLQA